MILALGVAGCGGGNDDRVAVSPSPSQPAAERSSEPPEPVAAVPTEPESATENWIAMSAVSFYDGEPLNILIPEGMTVPPDSLIEYREGADGKLYLESILPK